MGLAAPRKKTKISNDPNNTNWSRSTTGFGHKILSSQGWTPGSFLGARNAAHADLFTNASASHIRVIVKDNTLGLGARHTSDPLGEPTGLDAFKGLLGRLNGKSDGELQVEKRKRDDVKLARYAATKWQEVRFISGGLLVQEKIKAVVTQVPADSRANSSDEQGEDDEEKSSATEDKLRSKVSKKKKKSSDKQSGEDASKSEKREKKAKKRKHSESNELDAETRDKKSSETQSEVNENANVSQPKATAPSRERRPMGRQIFRGRHIAQKKKALMDDKSLNEIFMIKS